MANEGGDDILRVQRPGEPQDAQPVLEARTAIEKRGELAHGAVQPCGAACLKLTHAPLRDPTAGG